MGLSFHDLPVNRCYIGLSGTVFLLDKLNNSELEKLEGWTRTDRVKRSMRCRCGVFLITRMNVPDTPTEAFLITRAFVPDPPPEHQYVQNYPQLVPILDGAV